MTEIGDYAFYDTGIESIVLPDSLTRIGEFAFDICKNLKSLTLGKGLKEIATYAFGLCATDLTTHREEEIELTYRGKKEEWEKIDKKLGWNAGSKIPKVHCSNGDVEIEE